MLEVALACFYTFSPAACLACTVSIERPTNSHAVLHVCVPSMFRVAALLAVDAFIHVICEQFAKASCGNFCCRLHQDGSIDVDNQLAGYMTAQFGQSGATPSFLETPFGTQVHHLLLTIWQLYRQSSKFYQVKLNNACRYKSMSWRACMTT